MGCVGRMPGSRESYPHRRAVLLLLALAFSSASARAVELDPINLRFEVFGGPGLHFLTLRVRVDEAGGRYAIAVEADAQSRRFVCRSAEQARGAREGLRERFVAGSDARRDAPARRRLEYAHLRGRRDPGGGDAASDPVTPVTPAQMRGTFDFGW